MNVNHKQKTSSTLSIPSFTISPSSLGIYIHFPWCLQKCHYCDFYSLGLDSLKKSQKNEKFNYKLSFSLFNSYLKALLYELELRLKNTLMFCQYKNIGSIYFGGGTPSLMPVEMLNKILDRLCTDFELTDDCEITLEGNPEDMASEYLEEIYSIGIQRINVGIQSFQAEVLKNMNRFYNPDSYNTLLDKLNQSSFQDFGIDLIYGFPGQKEVDFYNDLETVLSSNPQHLSLYSLSVESNTAYEQGVRQGVMMPPSMSMQADIWDELGNFIQERLPELKQYEISNFAIQDKWSRHNMRYWLYYPYMGLGPGAHGFDSNLRYANPRNLQQWLKNPAQNIYRAQEAKIEMPMLFLRLCAAWPIKLWDEIFLDRAKMSQRALEASHECFESWVNQDLADIFKIDGEVKFQWRKLGSSFLDDRILEMNDAIL